MGRYRKRPVEVDAVRWTGSNKLEVRVFLNGGRIGGTLKLSDAGQAVMISALGGVVAASVGDWIIRGVHGEYYPCKPDIFEATYEEVAG